MSLDIGSSAIHLNLPPASSSQVRSPSVINIHPSVLASILTHHSRKPSESSTPRVIGTLMGTRSESGAEVEVRTSFALPHSEDENQIAFDMEFLMEMVDLLNKNGTKEVIVGWYATHSALNAYSAVIQNFFSGETVPYPAVHLTIDTDLSEQGKGLGVKGWVSNQLGLTPKPESCVFLPVPVQLKYADSERAALDMLTSQPTPSPSQPPLPTLAASLSDLSNLIDNALTYVKSVNAGTTQPDAQVGRYLLEGVGRWAGSEGEEGGVKAGLQDTLTVAYLANLVRSQVELSGRLTLLQQGTN
ncbi:Mov34-domain-containing protein [Kockovaella imperatae]|uniref:Eukaryotic translation initiation factor 3 subunit F n=1 Tax=Kockovaella imperatae TaxID=4999 RepID=A0A1Y1UDR8_9TREE|nr:Mov34-domain-containing protein [Kockovaella imperatae]ORX36129.1 Mov34-domain-containing protein [Kockovaella imperatae]